MAKYLRCIWTEFCLFIITKNIALRSYTIPKCERCTTKEEENEKWSGAWIRNCCQNFSCNISLWDPFSLTTHAPSLLISPTFFLPIEYSSLFTPLHLYHIALLMALILYYFSVLCISFTWRKINHKSRNRKLSLSRARWWPWIGSRLVWYDSITSF